MVAAVDVDVVGVGGADATDYLRHTFHRGHSLRASKNPLSDCHHKQEQAFPSDAA